MRRPPRAGAAPPQSPAAAHAAPQSRRDAPYPLTATASRAYPRPHLIDMEQVATPNNAAGQVKVESKSLHVHAFWLYSTIVALSMDQALRETIPNFIKPPAANPAYDQFAYAFRLSIFLVVVIRFYLGGAIFFERVHAGATADKDFPEKSYVIDFLSGLLHFLLFFVWAYSIDLNTKPPLMFPIVLAVILLWDVPWFLASLPFDPHKLIKLWMAINVLATGLGLAIYLFVLNVLFPTRSPQAYVAAEKAAYILIIIISMLDIWELVSKKQIFRRMFSWLLDDETGSPAPPVEEGGLPADRA